MSKIHRLFEAWLSGTECKRCYNARNHKIMFENDTHIVFKHGSHQSYVNRMSDHTTCRVYYVLYDKSKIDFTIC